MAILTKCPGFEVDVTVNGNALREYDLPADSDEFPTSDDSTIKYVEAQAGQEFAVRLRMSRQTPDVNNDLVFEVNADGEMRRALTVTKSQLVPGMTASMDGVKRYFETQVVLRKFVFSNLITEDRRANGQDAALASKIGQIVVKLYRVRYLGSSNAPRKYSRNDKEVATSVAEKALKGRALSRKIELGAALPSVASLKPLQEYLDPKNRPFAMFTFRYRAMEDLYAEMIVPRPIPLEDRDLESLNVEEMRELVRRQKADLERRNLRHQIEENRATSSGSQRIKRELKRERDFAFGENSGSASSRRRIETVDLTDE